MSEAHALHPEVSWAQRTDEIFVTINISDVKNDAKPVVTKDKISFSGIGGLGQKLYSFELELYKEINPEKSKISTTGRQIVLFLDKAEHGQAYWPRLQKEKGKIPYLKTDFTRWKDEDDDDQEVAADPMGGMDFSSLMGGAGAGEMDSDDEDEGLPALETADKLDNEPMNVDETPKENEAGEEKAEKKE